MIILVLIVLGLCLGSFVNALVWRIHQQSLPKKKRAASDVDLSISRGRSMCPDCKHQLVAQDLVPVISWLSTAGRCRYCTSRIHWQYPVVECLMASVFVLSYVWWPYGFELAGIVQFVTWLVMLVGFGALVVYDLRWMLLPNRVVFPLQAIAAISVLLVAVISWDFGIVLSAFVGVICVSGLFYVLFQVSKGTWIGGGDVKLGVVLGLFVGGPINALLVLFASSLLGSIVGLPIMVLSKSGRKARVPFGPFLIAATIVVYLFGAVIIDWYKRQFIFV